MKRNLRKRNLHILVILLEYIIFYLLEYAILKAGIHIGYFAKIRKRRSIVDQNFCCNSNKNTKFIIGFRNLHISKSMGNRHLFIAYILYKRMIELLRSKSLVRPLLGLFDAFLHETKESGKKCVALSWSEILSLKVNDY